MKSKILVYLFVSLLLCSFSFGAISFNSGSVGFSCGICEDTFLNRAGDSMLGDLDMNGNEVTDILYSQYNVTSCTEPELLPDGSVCWNPDEDTLNLVTAGGQIIQVGRELSEQGINREGSLVADGSVVYLSGASGDNPEFKLADGSDVDKSSMVGVVTVDCGIGELCPVTVFGFANGLDTSSWGLGDKLYMDASTPGAFTNVIPTLPNNPFWVATVVRVSGTVGRIFVNPQIDPSDGFLINHIYATGDITATNGNFNKINTTKINNPYNESFGTWSNETHYIFGFIGGLS